MKPETSSSLSSFTQGVKDYLGAFEAKNQKPLNNVSLDKPSQEVSILVLENVVSTLV
jgi:hypothetical protein